MVLLWLSKKSLMVVKSEHAYRSKKYYQEISRNVPTYTGSNNIPILEFTSTDLNLMLVFNG